MDGWLSGRCRAIGYSLEHDALGLRLANQFQCVAHLVPIRHVVVDIN